MGHERQKVQMLSLHKKLWQHKRAYFKNDDLDAYFDMLNQKEQVEPIMLAELKAELEAQSQ